MAQLESSQKYIETPTSETTKSQHSPTFEQLLQGDASWRHSTSPTLARHHDPEEDSSPHINKKSVLARVREKAKKLRHSFNGKKKNDSESSDGQITPPSPWGVILEDYDDHEEEDEDPEYLGAPMYESELAPECYKETARQHPRANPVVSEKHLWPTSTRRENEDKDKTTNHSKTITATMSEKMAPAYAAVSDATHTIASKIAGLTISGPKEEQKQGNLDVEHLTVDGVKNSEIGEHLSNRSPQKWDKGVSVKEYFMNKLEPGEDDKALSQVISEAISPRSRPHHHLGVVEKVREAVTSFLRHDEQPQSAAEGSKSETSMEIIKSTNLPPVKTEFEATKVKSLSPMKTVVSPPKSSANSSHVPKSPRASTTKNSSKETIKAANLTTNIPIPTKTEVPPANFTSSTSVNKSSHVPFSPSANSVEEPWKETTKVTNSSSNIPLFIKAEIPPLNSISSTNVNSLSQAPSPHGASSKEKSFREMTNATNLSSNNPLWIKTEVPPPSSISSTNLNHSTRLPLFRSVSLSPHVPVFYNASASPLTPISTSAEEDLEEQTQGRILQAN